MTLGNSWANISNEPSVEPLSATMTNPSGSEWRTTEGKNLRIMSRPFQFRITTAILSVEIIERGECTF